MHWDIQSVRAQFPALERRVVFFDNPGGTQISRSSLEAINHYLVMCNANHGGGFETSRDSDASVDAARAAMADFLNASSPDEIVFGPNMTTLTFNISRSLVRTFQQGDTIVVTRLDHDGNVSPWLLAAEDCGCRVRWVDINVEDSTLNMDDFKAAMAEKPKLVALGYASNATGTINPVKEMIRLAHEAGALVYIDAVQYAPHGPIDVQDLACDFLVCSAYKFFGPHLGVLYGRYDLLESLKAYRLRPAPALPPGKFETGTGNFEHINGLSGALRHLEFVGNTWGVTYSGQLASRYSGRRLVFKQAMYALLDYERDLSQVLLKVLQHVPGLKVYGIIDPQQFEHRLPVFGFTIEPFTPCYIAEALGNANIYVWDGHYYAVSVVERLGLLDKGGMVRVGAAHYNTIDEVLLLGETLEKIVRKG